MSSARVPFDWQNPEELIRVITEEVIAHLEGRRAPAGTDPRPGEVAALIDHTLLKPDASRADVERLCHEAALYGFASVCINPWYVPLAERSLRASGVKVCTVVGFPLGATFTKIKLAEADESITLGAREIDMVMNVGALRSMEDDQVEGEIRAIADLCHRSGAICKVILETALLRREEKVRAALIAKRVGVDFVKTSTGFSVGGATVEDVALLRETVGPEMGIKASGGVRSLSELQAMVIAGATRIGTSSGVKIIHQLRGTEGRDFVSPSPAKGPGPAEY
jgi:deoxyribose-phosphate aldolase